jgi:Phosphotransferase enzyme family
MDTPKSADKGKEWLAELLINELSPDADRSTYSCKLTGPVYAGSHSVVFRGEGSLFPFPVAVKQNRSPVHATHSTIDSARIQFAALERISSAFPDQTEARVPRAVALIEHEGIVVSEWLEGVPLNQILSSPANTLEDIEGGLIAAGTWLAAFHSGQQAQARPLDPRIAQALIDDVMKTTSRSYHALSSVAQVCELLESMAARIATVDVPFSWTHGDFKPHNILIHDGRAIGLDIGANFQNAILYDIAHFLNHLEVAFCHPSAFRLFRHRNRLVAAFRTAYGGLDELALPEIWLRLSSAIRLRVEHWATGRGVRRIYNDICFAFLVRRLAQMLRRIR